MRLTFNCPYCELGHWMTSDPESVDLSKEYYWGCNKEFGGCDQWFYIHLESREGILRAQVEKE